MASVPQRDKFVVLRAPNGGLNLDAPTVEVAPQQATALVNAIMHEPGVLRARYGWSTVTGGSHWDTFTFSAAATDIGQVTGAVTFQHKVLLGVVDTGSAGTIFPYFKKDRNNTPPISEPTYGGGEVKRGLIYADIDSSTVNTIDGTFQPVPFGASLSYESCSWFCGLPLTMNGGVATTSYGPAMWAGARPNGTTIGATMYINATVGSKTIDIVTSSGGATAPNFSMKGWFIQTVATGTEDPKQIYTYQIESHSANSTAATLTKPYGLGLTTASTTTLTNKTGHTTSWSCAIIGTPFQLPTLSANVCVHLDRLFIDRLFFSTPVPGAFQANVYYYNAIRWSDPGEPQKWSDVNSIQLDDDPDRMIRGMVSHPSGLLVFHADRTYVLLGTDESNFTVRPLFKNLGLQDNRSICVWNDSVIWLSRKGWMMWNGSKLTDLSYDVGKGGVKSEVLARLGLDGGTPNTDFSDYTTSAATVMGDYLVTQITNERSTPVNGTGQPYGLMCHLPTRAWSQWGQSGSLVGNPRVMATTTDGHVIGAHNTFLSVLGSMRLDGAPVTVPAVEIYDFYYNKGDSSARKTYIPFRVVWGDKYLNNGDSFRVRGGYVEHGIYCRQDSAQANGKPFNVIVTSDPKPSIVGTHTVTFRPRREATSIASLMPDVHYTEDLSDPEPLMLEGYILRVEINNFITSPDPTNDVIAQQTRVYNVRLATQPTRPGVVDNAVVV